MTEDFHWEEMHARTGDNLAASREILKDAGTVTRWSRTLREEVRRQRAARQQEREAQAPAPLPSDIAKTVLSDIAKTVSGDFVLVVRLEHDLDLLRSPQILRLFYGLAAGQGDVGLPLLEDRYLVLGGRHPVVLDLRGVAMVDGAGFSCLVAGHQVLAAANLRLMVLVAPGSQPTRVFAARGLGKIIPALGSLDEL